MKKLLELFAGTKSVGKVAKNCGFHVTSIDIEKKFSPTILCDILKWNYKDYSPGEFHVIWASPPCTEFSVAKTVGVRDLKGASRLVKKTLEIIEYFNPKYFIIENPVGLLRNHIVMKNHKHLLKTVSYCKYGFHYRKNTDLWTNVPFKPRKCEKGSLCSAKEKLGHHTHSVQGGTSITANGIKLQNTTRLQDRYKIPSLLLKEILCLT